MKNTLFTLILGCLLLPFAQGQTLVHYWNFNNSTDVNTLLTPNVGLVPGGQILHLAGGTSVIQTTSNTTNGFEVTNPNARFGDLSATHLRFNNPIGGILEFSLPTTGFQQAVVTYGTRRSGSGAGTQIIEYTTDGTTYQPFSTHNPVDGNPTLVTLNFSALPAVNNNPNFKIRVSFIQGPGGTVGNNRFDNFALDANPVGQDVTPPNVTLTPLNGATNQAVTTTPTILFSEDVRLVNNQAITAQDIPTLVQLRLNNAQGALVPFTGTFANNTITITPTGNLLNGQLYYVAVVPNTIEDLSNNAVVAAATTTFTTIAPQTIFQPGDWAPIAYRTNAVATNDEIAFVTFVNILPGTIVQFTDAKYTTNPQPQCPGGLTWVSPAQPIAAGSVIIIGTDAGTANVGTISGSTFGLSSGGEQVIVYTGSAAAPSYITALSTNLWVNGPFATCGGSFSMIPATLQDGTSSINLSTAPGNIAANTVNAYYNGTQVGSVATLRSAILDPANWVGVGANTPPQTWPNYAFPGPPSVTLAQTTSATTIRVIFNQDLNAASATTLANYTGIANLATATVTNNGPLNDTVTLTFSVPFANGASYTLNTAGVQNASGQAMLGSFPFTFTYNTTATFSGRFKTVSEGVATVTVTFTVTNPSPAATANLVFATGNTSSTASLADLTNAQLITPVTFNATTVNVTFQINDDQLEEQDEYIQFNLANATNCTFTGLAFYTVFIRDSDRLAPAATNSLTLDFVSRYTVPNPGNALGLAEIVTYDAVSQRLFTMSTGLSVFDIVDFSNPLSPSLVQQVDVSAYGSGITSIAVQNGIVAVSVPGAPTEQDPGHVVFFDTNGVFINQVTAGALPDMITFTPNGQFVLTANEGQPNDAYTVDPEGSVSIINISGGVANVTQANVNTLLFTQYNAQEAALLAAGVRKLKTTSTLSQDFEPEFITISPNSQTAWVTLQENGAIAEINLVNQTITNVRALGLKDFSLAGNGLDISDRGDSIHIANWPIKGYYLPDAVANYSVAGTTYLVTANEGDEKEYAGLNERTTVGAVNLDPTAFPNGAWLKENHNMGRHRITNLKGDTDNDGDYDELFTVGARSFSIWNAQTGTQVFDSGDDFETITAQNPFTRPIFNADHESNALKGRSRAKGPEPEGVTIANIGGTPYAFITLERIGGVMAYDITDPQAPAFTAYANSRSNVTLSGDRGPEGVIYIAPNQSPDGKGYVITANEISGTLAIYEVAQNCAAQPDVIFVNDNATGSNNGTSWDNAFTSLQSALSAATAGKQIWVAQGTYKPSANNRSTAFNLKAEVSLYGGFPDAGGCDLDDRNPELYPTILSGDIGTVGNPADNSYRVVIANNVGDFVTVDGFTITGARSNTNGGGVYVLANGINNSSSPLFANCVIFNNFSPARGGGVYVQASANAFAFPTFDNVRFANNTATVNGGALTALSQTGATGGPAINNCVFENNTANGRGGALESWTNTTGSTFFGVSGSSFDQNTATTGGGAIYVYARGGGFSVFTLDGSDFQENTASSGGAIYSHNGGAVLLVAVDSCTFQNNTGTALGGAFTAYAENPGNTNVSVANSTFTNNQANGGGAFYAAALRGAGQEIEWNQVQATSNSASNRGGALLAVSSGLGTTMNITGENLVIDNNTAPTGGGAAISGDGITTVLTNATFANNSATRAYHFFQEKTAATTLLNCVLWNAPFAGTTYTGTSVLNTSTLALEFSLIDATNCALLPNGTGTVTCTNSLFNTSPMFVNAANGNFMLMGGSPAIDAGTANGAPLVDFNGTARPQGNGIDLGAFEYMNARPLARATTTAVPTETIVSSLFPNPTTGAFSLRFDREVTGIAQVFDLQGRLVASASLNATNQAQFDLSAATAGLYLVRFVNGETITTQKVAVNKP